MVATVRVIASCRVAVAISAVGILSVRFMLGPLCVVWCRSSAGPDRAMDSSVGSSRSMLLSNQFVNRKAAENIVDFGGGLVWFGIRCHFVIV